MIVAVVHVPPLDIDGDIQDELAIMKKECAVNVNIYFYNGLVAGDWVYWDARSPTNFTLSPRNDGNALDGGALRILVSLACCPS